MNAVVDTNVVAYFLLGTEPFIHETRGFFSALDEGWAPSLWEAELANTLWMAIRRHILSLEDAVGRLSLADGLGIHVEPNRTLWQAALVRSHQSKIAVYDTLFVELAVRRRIPLVTFDAALLNAFPTVAARPAAVLARRPG